MRSRLSTLCERYFVRRLYSGAMGLRVLPFAAEHLDACGELLALRHRAHRTAEPLLPETDDPRGDVARAWKAEEASGAVAVQGGEVVGYLVGRIADDRDVGRLVWVEHAGHAATVPEVVRDLYALAAGRWVDEGARLHLALVPALPDLVDPWFRLGFGHMQVHGIRESGAGAVRRAGPALIRPGTKADLDAGRPLQTAIWEQHRLPPTLTGYTLPSNEVIRADWEETLEIEGCAYFVAEHEGRFVGHALLYPAAPDLASPAGSVYLAVAATLPEDRGLGVGLALTEHVLAWAREAGYGAVVTDWRMTNLLSSRFWPRRGFRPTYYRLCRVVEIG
jgi:ribosomal protein S18 acetylase RimI-like enzyme